MFGANFAISLTSALLLLATSRHIIDAFSPSLRGESRMFLDTANTKEWDELLPLGIFHGVTTNPTLLERAGEECSITNLHQMAAKALKSTNEFMCQAWGSTSQQMYDCGMKLSELDRTRIVVKVPVTKEGVQAASMLIQDGVRVCLTACYNHQQALIASSVGAEYLAPYLGRMTDSGLDGSAECLKMQQISRGMKSQTRILVASLRDSQTIADLAADGMETFTFSPDVARQLFLEPLTMEAAKVFEEAAAANNNKAGDDDVTKTKMDDGVEKAMQDSDEEDMPAMSYK